MIVRTLIVTGITALVFAFVGPHLGTRAREVLAGQDAPHAETGGPDNVYAAAAPAAGPVTLNRDGDGHYRADARVNGQPLRLMIDSGASVVVLTEGDARRAGIYPAAQDYNQPVSTAGGTIMVAPVTIDRLSIGGIERREVRGAVVQGTLLTQSLLGQSFMGQLAAVSIEGGRMTLR